MYTHLNWGLKTKGTIHGPWLLSQWRTIWFSVVRTIKNNRRSSVYTLTLTLTPIPLPLDAGNPSKSKKYEFYGGSLLPQSFKINRHEFVQHPYMSLWRIPTTLCTGVPVPQSFKINPYEFIQDLYYFQSFKINWYTSLIFGRLSQWNFKSYMYIVPQSYKIIKIIQLILKDLHVHVICVCVCVCASYVKGRGWVPNSNTSCTCRSIYSHRYRGYHSPCGDVTHLLSVHVEIQLGFDIRLSLVPRNNRDGKQWGDLANKQQAGLCRLIGWVGLIFRCQRFLFIGQDTNGSRFYPANFSWMLRGFSVIIVIFFTPW